MAIGHYGRDIVIIISAEHQNKKKYFDKFMDVLVSCGISKIEIYCGASTIKHSRLELDYALRESTYSLRACKILQKEYLTFSGIGVYQFLLPCEQNSYLQGFANRYLEPLFEEESEQNRKHMETAISYVLNGGQIKETATQLNIHENTARYRIEKLKEKLDSDVTEYEFYSNLNIAIKLYQLKED